MSVRTLLIAAVASATAAIVTSHFWRAGTPITAAVTPVIVALVSELLHRPTERIAQRITVDRTAVLPEGAGAGPPPQRPEEEPLPRYAPSEPGSEQVPVRVYGRRQKARRRIAVGVVVTTAVLAFAIAAAALTVPELIGGGSIGGGDRDTTIFGGRDKKASEPEEAEPSQPQTTEPEQPEQTTTGEEKTDEEKTPTEPDSTQTTPTTPTQTTPAPAEP